MERRYDTRAGTVTMRAQTADDETFLWDLFRSHAERELGGARADRSTLDHVVAHQYRAATGTHRLMFPDAAYSIIESDGQPIGRLIEHDEGERVYFVDFALLPEHQARGLGTAYIELVADEWAEKGRAARVEVQHHNTPSLKLCKKLGFVLLEDLKNGYVNLLRPVAVARLSRQET